MVLFVAYSATFISFLAVQHHHLPFTDFQGALDDGTYRVDVLAASADIDYFKVIYFLFLYHFVFYKELSKWSHVKWVHCHHGMARIRVAEKGDGLQICRVAENILSKQSRTADSGWSSSLGVGRGANNPPT
jgi:hypothetical protein